MALQQPTGLESSGYGKWSMEINPLTDKALLLREGDDVAVAKTALAAGAVLGHDGRELRLAADVPAGHKIALRDVPEGASVRKYGQTIGFATRAIAAGDWVHTQNMSVGPLALQYEFGTEVEPVRYVPSAETRTFPGYQRADGRVGTRNTVSILSSVNCSADTVYRIAERLRPALAEFPNVDDIVPIGHKGGCGTQMGGADHKQLQRTIAGFADHPNVGAYMLVGLGCEVNQPFELAREGGLIGPTELVGKRPEGPPILSIQGCGGIRKTIERGVEIGLQLLRRANEVRRTPQPVGSLIVGTNCGGSDAHSGITANPALGVAGDELVRHRGTWLIAETTETYGAEHLLTKRAVSREVGDKLLQLMRWWEWYTATFGAEIDNNPAPGNKEGGLTTIYEKSLGAMTKGGTTPLVAVYDYAQRITDRGFCFMDTPGLDPVSVTGLVAGGCNLVAFTTGRGSCLGFKPAPSLKIATNSALYEHMNEDMDIDAGVIMNGVPVQDVGLHIFEELIAVAGGKRTKSEAQGLGEQEFAPWVLGPVL
jgi:altronate hydrolase